MGIQDKASTKKVISLISCHPIFRSFNQQELQQLYKLTQLVRYNNKDIIVRQNDPVDAIYFIFQGFTFF